jgi:vaccinia related kinase
MPPKKGKKPVKGYEMAEFIKAGTQIKDAHKREWVVGEPVGKGGFGMIYLCDRLGSSNDIDNAVYVIKIEPKSNGPLFTEINYYQRNCKPADIDNFAKKSKLKVLGIPKFISAGIHVYNGKELRYLIMPRFGRDLQKLFVENGTKFNKELISQIATKMLFSLEYMHNKRYAHADIKGANILLGNEIKAAEKEELFLIDFGLAYLVPPNVQHKPDPRCKHDGTIEYCSTDAHDGSKPSFRGDIEILCWCLSHWASGSLPWINLVKENMSEADKEKVGNKKREATKNPKKFLAGINISDFRGIESLLSYSAKLDYSDLIDFDKCRAFFKTSLPKGNKLCLTKVKSRKSFVNLKSSNLPVSTPKKNQIEKKVPKSTKRRIRQIESSSDDDIQPNPKRYSPDHEESSEISSTEDAVPSTRTTSARTTRNSTRSLISSTRSTRARPTNSGIIE